MTTYIPFDNTWLEQLIRSPDQTFHGSLGQQKYSAQIVIPHYLHQLERYFQSVIGGSLQNECSNSNVPFTFEHFGVSIKFQNPLEVNLYDNELFLNPGLLEIINRIGPIMFKNVYFNTSIRDDGHRNRFPQFQFHIDRSKKQPTRYSLYTRNPFDEEQKYPRTASTLFTSNISAYLQGVKQGLLKKHIDQGSPTSALLFEKEDLEDIFGKVILEQRWDEPEGTGEIAIIDNATVLHASYYRDASQSGYRIGVRYLAGNEIN